MKKLSFEDILPLDTYLRRRDEERRRAIELRNLRRVSVGDRISLSFENRDTVRYQIHEMMRAEGLRQEQQVRHEVAVYNELIPPDGSLSATFFIEIQDQGSLRSELDRLIGLDEPGRLKLEFEGHAVPAEFEPGHSKEDRIAAVHYVQFALPQGARQRFLELDQARLVVTHPDYEATAIISGETLEALKQDLSTSRSAAMRTGEASSARPNETS